MAEAQCVGAFRIGKSVQREPFVCAQGRSAASVSKCPAPCLQPRPALIWEPVESVWGTWGDTCRGLRMEQPPSGRKGQTTGLGDPANPAVFS